MEFAKTKGADSAAVCFGDAHLSAMSVGAKKTPPPKERASNTLGIAVSDIPADQKKALKLTNGVMVDAVEGPAARAGFQKGDIILRIGDTDITSAKQFDAVAQNVDPSKMVAVLVRRGDNTQFVPLRPRAPVQK